MFLYYTNLSNLAAAIAQAALFFASFRPESALWHALCAPGVRLAMTLCLAVTGIVYWTMLAPGAARRGETLAAGRASSLLHGVSPVLMVAEWLLFADKTLSGADAAMWLIVPAAYFTFILVRARLCGPIPGRSSPYPYHFMNLERLGPVRFTAVAAGLLAGFFLLGLAFVWLGRALSG